MAQPLRIRATMIGNIADVKVIMNHPMETGLRKDAKTGQMIPAHYITEVTATLNGKKVLEASLSGAVSSNPFLGFKLDNSKAGDKLAVNWVDNKGDKNTGEVVIS